MSPSAESKRAPTTSTPKQSSEGNPVTSSSDRVVAGFAKANTEGQRPSALNADTRTRAPKMTSARGSSTMDVRGPYGAPVK